ncbi:MAG TPA: porin [Polyangia bacterium]|jgi:phosphate-selective porin
MLHPHLARGALVATLLAAAIAHAQQPGAVTVPVGELRPGQSLRAIYSDGFVLSSVDGKNELRIAASAQLDGRYYPGTPGSPDSFDIRRARLDLGAKLLGFMDIRVQAALEDTPYLRNAFMDLYIQRWLRLRVGQFKVPFSTQWLTLDNQLDFLERSTAEPLYPFIDRGAMLWGGILRDRIVYNLGVFDGAGVDADAPKGDIDHHKEVAYRLFLQPFRKLGPRPLQGLYFAGQGTYEVTAVPTRRFETRGLVAPDFESVMWRWRTEQTLGTNGRDTDLLTATIARKQRWGAEAHYLLGPLTLSAEWVMIRYTDIQMYHELWQGQSKRVTHDAVGAAQDAEVHSISGYVSVFVTGERKYLDNFGWRQPTPLRPIGGGADRGWGALELLARVSRTWVPQKYHGAFADVTPVSVKGYTTADATGIKGPVPAEGASITAAVFDGAKLMYELTLGANWTLNYHCRVQADYTYLVAPNFRTDAAGNGVGGIVTGANAENLDALQKNQQKRSVHELGVRFIFRI